LTLGDAEDLPLGVKTGKELLGLGGGLACPREASKLDDAEDTTTGEECGKCLLGLGRRLSCPRCCMKALPRFEEIRGLVDELSSAEEGMLRSTLCDDLSDGRGSDPAPFDDESRCSCCAETGELTFLNSPFEA